MTKARALGLVLVCLAGSAAAQEVTSRVDITQSPCGTRDVPKNEDAARILAGSPGLSNRTPRGDASTNRRPVDPDATSSADGSSPTTGPFGELSLSPSPPQPVIRLRTRVPRSTPKKH
jgi:hypothetical protein